MARTLKQVTTCPWCHTRRGVLANRTIARHARGARSCPGSGKPVRFRVRGVPGYEAVA
jgi:hypothetical protein